MTVAAPPAPLRAARSTARRSEPQPGSSGAGAAGPCLGGDANAAIGAGVPAHPLRVLVACEYSGAVRNAFLALGHDAWSCDLLPAEDGSPRHIVGDARDLLGDGWDVLIAHPPCTRLCNSGVRWLHEPPPGRTREEMWAELEDACALFSAFWNAPVPRIAVENPLMHGHAKARIAGYRPPSASVHPWEYGHGETKHTCLWLRGLPPLMPTDVVPGREARVHRMAPGPNRWAERSRTYAGIARAMASQWSAFLAREVAA